MTNDTAGQIDQKTFDKIYNRNYFLNKCAGYSDFKYGMDKIGDHRLRYALQLSGINSESVVLDAGFGRGELVYQSVKSGAKKVYGIDVSKSAIKISQQLLKKLPKSLHKKMDLRYGFVQKLPYKKDTFTIIYFLDVIEHLSLQDAKLVLANFFRVLKPAGTLIIHTDNRIYIQYTRYIFYYLNRLFDPSAKLDDQTFEKTGHLAFYSRNELRRILTEQGYRNIKVYYPPVVDISQIKAYFNLREGFFLKLVYILSRVFSRTIIYNMLSPTLWAQASK